MTPGLEARKAKELEEGRDGWKSTVAARWVSGLRG